jgi:hypothetical protein
MQMMPLKRVMAFAALSLSSALGAQAVAATYVFSTVTGIQYGSGITITGVLANGTTPTTYALPGAQAYCGINISSFLSTMISNPGTYTLTLVVTDVTDPTGPPANILSCRLDRTN